MQKKTPATCEFISDTAKGRLMVGEGAMFDVILPARAHQIRRESIERFG